MYDTKKPIAVVTGGSRGIGAAVCRELASQEVYVFIGYNNSEAEARQVQTSILGSGGSCSILNINVNDEESIIRAVEEVKSQVEKIDMLACCAGVEDFTAVEDIKKSVFDKVFNTNTFGQFKCVSEFHKLMTAGGRIVLTSSVSVRMSVRQHMLYAASKAAVECFVKNAALELGDKGIAINTISPGAVATGMAAENAHKYIPKGLRLELSEWKEINNACKRIGNVGEIAKAYSFLLSNDVPFMTGSLISIDGGRI